MKCKVSWCDNDIKAKGLCNRHYMQIFNYGRIKGRTQRDPNRYVDRGDHYEIECYDRQGNVTGYILIDSADRAICEKYKWSITVDGYAWNNKVGKMHHLLLNHPKNTDHKNANKIDNRRDNLRACTQMQNIANTGLRTVNKSGFKGVSWNKPSCKWLAQIKHKGKQYRLGLFDDITLAAKAYNKKAKEIHGEFAFQNEIGE